jgi:hypothetical protein
MSSTTESVQIQNSPVKEVKPKAPRKPTLPAKYSKMLVFGYTLAESLRAKGVLSDELVDQVFDELRLMSTLDDQVSYYESVVSQAGANAKVMKKFIAAKNKPVKEPKVRKPRAKKTVTVQSDASDDDVIQGLVDAARDVAEPKEKKQRKNTKKGVEVPVEAKAEKEPKAKAEKEPKAKAEKEPKAKAEKELKVKAEKELKTKAEKEPKVKAEKEPKTKKEPKAKAEKEPLPESDSLDNDPNDDDDEEEILTKETTVDGIPFLIDQHNNLYDPVSHDFVRQI